MDKELSKAWEKAKTNTMKPKVMDKEDMMFMEHMMPMKKTMKAGTKKKAKKV